MPSSALGTAIAATSTASFCQSFNLLRKFMSVNPCPKTLEFLPLAVVHDSGRGGLVDASKHLESVNLAPDGERTIVVARGDLFSVPAKNGTPRNLSKTSGAHERDAIWSPDGKWIAYN